MANSAPGTHGKKHWSESTWRWVWGMAYVVAVALIWIAASFVVQSVEDEGVSSFLITYVCNSLFIIYIPIVEGRRYLEFLSEKHGGNKSRSEKLSHEADANVESEKETLLYARLHETGFQTFALERAISEELEAQGSGGLRTSEGLAEEIDENGGIEDEIDKPWTRMRTAFVGLAICPFWLLAEFTFNLSLKYTTVTSNTILSTASSMFTFLVSLQFLGETFTYLKLASVILCMAGTIIVSVGDSWKGEEEGTARNPFLGDVICLLSTLFYATYTALIRAKIPDEDDMKGKVSTALVFGYLGLFNALFLTPVALILHFTGRETVFHGLTLKSFGLIVVKGLLDNVLSDYLWARAVLLTTPTAATAGLTIQVPIAAGFDFLRGVVPSSISVVGAIAVLLGFLGINRPALNDSPPVDDPVEEDDGTEENLIS